MNVYIILMRIMKVRLSRIITDSHVINTGNSNPNFEKIREIKKISFNNKIIYEPEFGLCGLSEDETAIAVMMKNTAEYSRGNASAPYSMEDALADSICRHLTEEGCGNREKWCIVNIMKRGTWYAERIVKGGTYRCRKCWKEICQNDNSRRSSDI
ncbi:MAG: hypothetical protein ACLUZ6_04970 [Lachnospira eligens]